MGFSMQPSFTGGELSPALYARVDMQKYHTGCRTLKNMLVHPHGGASNRPGTKLVDEVKDSSVRHRLVPFEFSVSQAYALEFGHKTMRVIYDGGLVLDSDTDDPFELETPYKEDDLPELKFTQSADVLIITHQDYAPRKLSRLDHDEWELEIIDFTPSVPAPENIKVRNKTSHTGKEWSYVVTAVSNGEESLIGEGSGQFNAYWDIENAELEKTIDNPVKNLKDIIDVYINPEGNRLFVYTMEWITYDGESEWVSVLRDYLLSSDYDVEGCSHQDTGYTGSSSESQLDQGYRYDGIWFKPDGKRFWYNSSGPISDQWTDMLWDVKMNEKWVLGSAETNDDLGYNYTKRAPYDRFAESTNSTQLRPGSSVNHTLRSFRWDENGLQVIALEHYPSRGPKLKRYPCPSSTAWGYLEDDQARLEHDQSKSLSDYCDSATCMYINNTGTNLFIYDRSQHKILSFVMSPWDLDSLSPVGELTPDCDSGHIQIFFKENGERLFVFSPEDEKVLQYSLTSSELGGAGISGTSCNGPKDSAPDKLVEVTWDEIENADHYKVYKKKGGVFGFVGRANEARFMDDYIQPDTQHTPPMTYDPFSGVNPAVCAFYQQRLLFASTSDSPQTLFGSRVGNYYNMGRSVPPRDDDAIEYTLASPTGAVNEIRSLVGLRKLMVLTAGAEWQMAGADGGALTPTSVQAEPQSYNGISRISPLVIGNNVILVGRDRTTVRNLAYSFEVDGYAGNDLIVMAGHLLDGHTIEEWAYAQTPFSVVWAIRDDGVLLGLTYLPEHEVWGWHRHETDGEFESVCSISGETQTDVYFIVKRTIDGQDKRFIERMMPRIKDRDPKEAFFVDCGLTYRGDPATTISGLDHLEGEKVSILADGAVMPKKTVEDGEVEISSPAEVVHVGLPYKSDLETLELELEDNYGTAQGRSKTISQIILRLKDTMAAWAGASEDSLYEVQMRDGDLGEDASELYTGDKVLIPEDNYGTAGRVFVRQADPVPMTVLAVIPEIMVGSR